VDSMGESWGGRFFRPADDRMDLVGTAIAEEKNKKSDGAKLMKNVVECVDDRQKKTAMRIDDAETKKRTDDAVIRMMIRDGDQIPTKHSGDESRDVVMKNVVGKTSRKRRGDDAPARKGAVAQRCCRTPRRTPLRPSRVPTATTARPPMILIVVATTSTCEI